MMVKADNFFKTHSNVANLTVLKAFNGGIQESLLPSDKERYFVDKHDC